MTLPLVTPYDLTVSQPKAIKAWVDDAWRDVSIPLSPKGQPRWKMVHETLSTLQATRVQLLDQDGSVIKAIGEPPSPGPAPGPGATGIDLDTFASRMGEAQRIALTAHVEAMRPAWAAVEASGKLVSEMAKQMTAMLGASAEVTKSQQELVAKLAELLQDVTDDAVAGRLEAAELARDEAQSKSEQTDKVAGLMEKALDFVGPALAERLTPH